MAANGAGSPTQRVHHKISLALNYCNICCKMNIENFNEMCIAVFPAGVGEWVPECWVNVCLRVF